MPLRSVLAWSLVLPWVLWAVVRLVGLDRIWPLVGVMAFTPWAVAGALAGSAVAYALKRRLAAVLGAACVVALAVVVAPRALGSGADTATGERPLRVLTLNLMREGARADAVVALVRRRRADVLVVQELRPEAEQALAAEGLRDRLPNAARSRGVDTAIFARVPLRRRTTDVPTGTAALVGVRGAADVELLTVHPRPPINRPNLVEWRGVLDRIPSAGRKRLRVAAGDFNATLDHRELRQVLDRGYVDAAAEAGAGLRTTWPVGRRLPPMITIDHVLADERIDVGEVSIHEVPGTDHRAVFAELIVPRR